MVMMIQLEDNIRTYEYDRRHGKRTEKVEEEKEEEEEEEKEEEEEAAAQTGITRRKIDD